LCNPSNKQWIGSAHLAREGDDVRRRKLRHSALSVGLPLAAALVLANAACAPEPGDRPGPPTANETIPDCGFGSRFTEVTVEAGLDFHNLSGDAGQPPRCIIETQSAGAAFLDYNGDGFLDIFAVNGSRLADEGEAEPAEATNRLFENTAHPSGSGRLFVEVTEEAGLRRGGWGMGAAAADYDNDGDPDLYVTYWGPNLLYRNQGDGTFVEVGEAAGVGDPGWGSSTAFADLDNDGHLDLYVVNYLEVDLGDPPGGGQPCNYKELEVYCGPAGVPAQPDRLYRNRGDGTFADMTEIAGVGGHRFPALGVTFFDSDLDGDLDIYVANDGEANLLYRNDGDWSFTMTGIHAGVAFDQDGMTQAGMGVHSGDYDNDGDFDLFVTNFSDDDNTLYQNDGDGLFEVATYAQGLGGSARPFLGWGTALCDFDNDGWLDLFIANGHLYPQLGQPPSGLRYAQGNLVYGSRAGHFEAAGPCAGPGLDVEKASRAAALGDYDNDGDTDVLVMNMNAPPTLLRNDGGNWNSWLGLDLEGVGSNRDAIGARVIAVVGERTLLRQVERGYGFQASHDPRLVIGLGGDEEVSRVDILWPSGHRQELVDPPLRRYLRIREGDGGLLAGPAVPPGPRPEGTAPARPAPAVLAVGEPGWTRDDFIQAGKDLYGRGHYGEARAALEQALELDPGHQQARVNLAVILHSGLGDTTRSVGLLEEVAREAPDRVDVHFLLGRLLLKLGHASRAVAVLTQTARLSPNSWETHDWLGLAYQRTDSLRAAAVSFEESARLAPWKTRSRLHLWELYRLLGDSARATREQREYERLDRLAVAEERGLRLLKSNSDQPETYIDLGHTYLEQRRPQLAASAFQTALQSRPESTQAMLGLGRPLFHMGRLPDALNAFRRACLLQPDLLEAFEHLGRTCMHLRAFGPAVEAYRRAVELAPGAAARHLDLSLALAAQGKRDEALRVAQDARELDPTNREIARHLARLRAR